MTLINSIDQRRNLVKEYNKLTQKSEEKKKAMDDSNAQTTVGMQTKIHLDKQINALAFEINEKRHYVLRYVNSSRKMKQSGAVIGDYGCTFNKSSRFIYRCASFCDGFYIRKKNWITVMSSHTFVSKNLGLKINLNH